MKKIHVLSILLLIRFASLGQSQDNSIRINQLGIILMGQKLLLLLVILPPASFVLFL